MYFILVTIFCACFMQDSKCASSSQRDVGKILGGKHSKLGEYPYILSLENSGHQFCGASAIAEYWALTAGHCVQYITEIEDLAVRAGTIVKGTNGTVHHVQRVIVHHNFNSRDFLDNDIALLQVVEPFSKNKYVKYVELPDQGEITPVGTKAWVAGWGLTKPDMKGRTSLLKHANVNVLEKERCEDSPKLTGMYAITSGMICAENKGRSSYKGDSGGPLVVKMGKKVKQIGVVSWGDYTGRFAFPGIYTKVSQYRLWIYLKSNI